MNRHILLIASILVSILFSACARLNCTPEQHQYLITPNQDISYSFDNNYDHHQYEIIDGDLLLFEFLHSNHECEDVFDDEYAEVLRFAIEPGLNEFQFADSAMISAKAHYYEIGAWVTGQRHQLVKGSIHGTELTHGNWQVEAVVTVFYDAASGLVEKEIRFSEVFEIK